ncbi:MAG: hypothetical protein JSS91_09790 [Bacteroidetes bacterium]|nr:hypothetical protein [Bacteroidota bacterium]
MKKLLGPVIITVLFLVINNTGYSQDQTGKDNPDSYKYYRIETKKDNENDTNIRRNLIKLEDELFVPDDFRRNQMEITVDKTDPEQAQWTVTLGDENAEDRIFGFWADISQPVRDMLDRWRGNGTKVNLILKKITPWTIIDKPYKDMGREIKRKKAILAPQKFRDISSSEAYISPYFQAFGGEPLGIPIKGSVGLSFQFGTPYSGPMETDIIGASFNIAGISLGVTTRIKEFVQKRSSNDTAIVDANTLIANYNNLFAPHLGVEASIVLPFLKILKVGFFRTLDTLDNDYDPPVRVKNSETGELMPNNVIKAKRDYVNAELRYPFTFFNSSFAKVYLAHSFDEYHMGFVAREVYIDESLFDVRTDVMFGNKNRNFQILVESMIANIGSSFARSSFAIGPSVRLGTKSNGNFGFISLLVNMRVKIGDFWERNAN